MPTIDQKNALGLIVIEAVEDRLTRATVEEVATFRALTGEDHQCVPEGSLSIICLSDLRDVILNPLVERGKGS